jgi:predicted nucleic acid-binding protein
MPSKSARASFFDASALVKLYVDEPESNVVRGYFNSEATKYTTVFCFYEALNILKTKWLYHGKLSHEKYLEACFALTAWYAYTEQWVKNLDITDIKTLWDARKLAEEHELDMSDALQILTVKLGYFSRMCSDSQTVFVTADQKLAQVAMAHGLRVWNVLKQEPPE